MKYLLLGNGLTIKSIKKFLKSKKENYIQAVNSNELKRNMVLLNEDLLNLNDIDYVIKSPGISETNKLYLKLKTKFKFISELDLLSIYKINTKTIVITGSNGKTTLVTMLTFLLKKANKKVISCGNSFKPITHYYKHFNKVDYLIIEQSSFQLHNLSFYNPYISIILNIQENHLDMSYSLNSYIENKKNIYKYQNKENYFIYKKSKYLSNINTNANVINALNYNSNYLYKDNLDYIYTIFKIIDIDSKYLTYINKFKQLKYRLNAIKHNNNYYINDSKSTSVDSTLFAINTIDKSKEIILIIGGKDKKISFNRLNNKVKYIICYGQINKIVTNQIDNVIITNTLKQAFLIAKNIEIDNKIILFSPSTSSFDQFKSYKERGKYFNYLIKKYG